MTGEPQTLPPQVLEYGTKPGQRGGMAAIALIVSTLLPGLGHYLMGDRAGAKRWFATFLGLAIASVLCLSIPLLVPAIVVLLPIGLVAQIALWISAFRSAKHSVRTLFKSALLRYLCAGVTLLVILFVAPLEYLLSPWRRHVAETFIIPTMSMSPTMVPRDRFIVHKLVALKRFDIVVVHPVNPATPNDLYTERIVGFPGETIELKNGGVSVNGQWMNPPAGVAAYVDTAPWGPMKLPNGKPGNGVEGNPITLGPDEYFFLGDNSPISGDSRNWHWSVNGGQPGTLPRSHIKGVATWTYFPISRWRKLY